MSFVTGPRPKLSYCPDVLTPCGYTATTSTTRGVGLDELLKLSREMAAERDRVNAGLVKALREFIGGSGEKLHVWAERLGIPFVAFVETLSGERQPDWHFWEQVRRVFGNPPRPG